jgi:hypothetical protein
LDGGADAYSSGRIFEHRVVCSQAGRSNGQLTKSSPMVRVGIFGEIRQAYLVHDANGVTGQ